MVKQSLLSAKRAARKIRSAVTFTGKRFSRRSGRLWFDKELNFFLSRRCNARCPHCYLLQVDKNVFFSQDMPLERAKQVIDAYPGFKRINLSGGEALLHPEVIEMIEFCISRKKEIQLLTNSIALVNYADTLKHLKIENLHISMDSCSSEEFLEKRGLSAEAKANRTLFTDIGRSIRAITSHRPKAISRIGVSFVMDMSNYFKIFDYVSFAESLNVDYATFTNFHSTDPDKENAPLFSGNDEVMNALHEVHQRRDYAVDVHLPLLYGNNPGLYCGSLFSQVTVDPEGNLAPCCHINPEKKYGNVFETLSGGKGNHVERPWDNPETNAFRKQFLAGNPYPPICVLCKSRFKYHLSFSSSAKTWYQNQQY